MFSRGAGFVYIKTHYSHVLVIGSSDFVTILQLRVLGLITCKYHESPNENCESQNFGSRELLYCIVFVLFTVYVNSFSL